MYPLTKLLLIKKAISHYARNLPANKKIEIEQCLSIIAFGMKTTLFQFQDQYYNYKGVVGSEEEEENEDNNGLAIGAFKAAFCTDTSTTYIYEMCESIIRKLKYAGSYHDDGLAIFDEQKMVQQTVAWLCNFQLLVDEV
eukprot:4573829-Ditylum_brightwellii.AAC.1